MQNIPTLSDLDAMKPSEVADLPVDQLCALFGEIKGLEVRAKASKALITDAVLRKYDEQIAGKESGVVTLVNDDRVTLKVVKKKYADWDQDELIDVENTIREKWGRDPSEYIKTKRSVAEAAYKNWPADLQAMFTPARTTKISAPSISAFETASKE